MLLLSVLASSPGLHAWLHNRAGEADHECVITLYQHGVVAAAAVPALVGLTLVFVAWVAIAPAGLGLVRARHRLPPAHAPPAGGVDHRFARMPPGVRRPRVGPTAISAGPGFPVSSSTQHHHVCPYPSTILLVNRRGLDRG